MKAYLAVGIGGIIGSSLRYLISLLISVASFPWSTLIVNVTGAFLLTFILFHPSIKAKLSPIIFTAITTGIIGSYTTFSTITVEVVMLLNSNYVLSIIYLFATIFGGLFCSYLGFRFSYRLSTGSIEK
ncbi:fluoride efflux transporter FluC [Pseudogracilibacillus sp. SO30301A]|uniref:fluoride efflux transporter FluC n=1 Tax=Pseudogracilibacillus sp. SO30301A TaxID=3098291 RepID=UPI00300DF632